MAGKHDAEIKSILRSTGLVNENEANEVLAKLPAAPPSGVVTKGIHLGGFCKLLCQIAQAACKIACSQIPLPAGQQLCIMACDAGEGICEKKCA